MLTGADPRVVRGCLIGLGFLIVASQIGVASSPYLVNNAPLLLIAISPLSRHVILVAPVVGPGWILLVAGVRTLLFTALSDWLGRTLGETALTWVEERGAGAARFVRALQRFFERWSYLAVFLFPLGAMACIAGVSRMPPAGFFAVAIPGILFRLGVYAWFGETLRTPILGFLAFIRVHQVETTALLVACVAGYQIYKWKNKRVGPH